MRSLARHPGWIVSLWLVLAVGAVVFVRLRGVQVPTTRVLRRDLEQHVVASGRVRVPTRVSIAAQVPGLVIVVGASEGQRVQAGDLLLQLWDAEARAAVAQAKAAVDQAAARVDQLRKVGALVASETTRQADTNYERAAAELARSERLSTTGAVSQSELDDARRRLEIARAQRNAAQVQQIALSPLGADSRVVLSALLQSQAQHTAANLRLEQTRIVARQAGVILSRNVQPGDVVQPAQALLVLAADADTELVISPDERNLAWIALGQKARASADAYPEQVFDAEVSYIAPSVDARRGSVEVRLLVPKPPNILKPDMTVSVDLTVAAKRGVLTLLATAVRGAATREPWVLVAEGGRAKKRGIQLGIRGDDLVEVTSGLDEHSVVLLSDPPVLVGERVRPAAGDR